MPLTPGQTDRAAPDAPQTTLDRRRASPYTRPVRGEMPAGPDSHGLAPVFFAGAAPGAAQQSVGSPLADSHRGDPVEDQKL